MLRSPPSSPLFPYTTLFRSLVLVTAVTIWRAMRWPSVLVGWLWFLGTLVPMIGLLQVGNQSMADRYTYFSITSKPMVLKYVRSEEHTSELQSQSNLVCRLLL